MKLFGGVKYPGGQAHRPSAPQSPPLSTEHSAVDVHKSPTLPALYNIYTLVHKI